MAMENKKVDDIWKQMNARPIVKDTKKFDQVWSKIQQRAEPSTSKAKGAKKENLPTGTGACSVQVKRTTENALVLSTRDMNPTAAEVLEGFDGKDVFAFGQHVQRDLNSLQDPSARTRTRALQRILAVLNATPEELPKDLLLDAAPSLLVKPLLRRFEDPVERCRELAVAGVLVMATQLKEVVLELLPYCIPVLMERLALMPDKLLIDKPHACVPDPVEPSEETRVALVSLLAELIHQADQGIAPYASDVAEIFKACARDQCPEALVATCQAAEALSHILTRRMQPVSHQMVKTMMPIFDHKRSKVRVACIRAVNAIMHCGAHETILDLSAFRHPNLVKIEAFYGDDCKINWFGKMCTDSNASVREEWVRCAGDWCVHLWERLDHETRLIPYVIHGVGDEAPNVQAAGMEWLQKIGDQYEKEKKEDLKDVLYYHTEDLQLPGGEYLDGEMGYLCAPFKARPSYGMRKVTMDNIKPLLYPILKELSVWTEESRSSSIRLLRSCIIIGETYISQHVFRILPVFIQVVGDPVVRDVVLHCCRLLGRFVEPEHYVQLCLRQMGAGEISDQVCTSATTVLRCTLLGSAFGSNGPNVREILDVLLAPDMLRTHHAALKVEAVELLEALALLNEADVHANMRDVIVALMHFNTPAPAPLPALQAKVRQVLRQLALPTGLSVDELLATYREPLMNGLQMSVKMWGTFETELLRSITDAIHAHPTSGDVRRLLSLVLEVVAHTGQRTQARVLPSLACLALTSTPLDDGDGERTLSALFARLPLQLDPPAPPSSRPLDFSPAPSASTSAVFPAVDAIDVLVANRLVSAEVLRDALKNGGWTGVRAGLESASAPELRGRCLALLGGVLGAYPPLKVFPPRGGIQEELPQCLLDRIEDSSQEVRVGAMQTVARLVDTMAARDYPEVHRKVHTHCTLPHLREDTCIAFQEALAQVGLVVDLTVPPPPPPTTPAPASALPPAPESESVLDSVENSLDLLFQKAERGVVAPEKEKTKGSQSVRIQISEDDDDSDSDDAIGAGAATSDLLDLD